jgi:hypothetical protein
VFDFGPYIKDVDNPPSDLVLVSDDPVGAAVSGFNVSFLYPQDLLDQWVFVTLTVYDPLTSTAKVVAVKVTSDTPPVRVKPLPDVTLTEGESLQNVFDLDDYFTDPDGDVIFFSFGFTHINVTIEPDNTVDIAALGEWNGQESVTFRATDPTGAIAEDTILVTVLPVDDPPVLGSVPDLRVRYDEAYSFNLEPYIEDVDTAMEAINVSTDSPYITVSGRLITLLFPFSLNDTSQVVTIWVGDGTSVVSTTIRVAIGEDRPPRLRAKLPNRAFPEDTVLEAAYYLPAYFEDPDSTTLYYSSGNRSILVFIDEEAGVDLSALGDWYGTERVTFRAVDPEGALAEDTVWITVLPVNDAPAFKPIPKQVLNVTTVFLDLTPYIEDVDNNITDLRLTTTSSRATVIGHGILLQYGHDIDDEVEVTVSDGILSATTSISVEVRLPKPGTEIPGWLYWIFLPIALGILAAFVTFRWRELQWVFLITNSGLLVASTSKQHTMKVDQDQVSALLTAIQDFATASFSDERKRFLEAMHLGERKVSIVRGRHAYLAVVYVGRTPGRLPHLMRTVLDRIELTYGYVLLRFHDVDQVPGIPPLLEKLLKRGRWPFLEFPFLP